MLLMKDLFTRISTVWFVEIIQTYSDYMFAIIDLLSSFSFSVFFFLVIFSLLLFFYYSPSLLSPLPLSSSSPSIFSPFPHIYSSFPPFLLSFLHLLFLHLHILSLFLTFILLFILSFSPLYHILLYSPFFPFRIGKGQRVGDKGGRGGYRSLRGHTSERSLALAWPQVSTPVCNSWCIFVAANGNIAWVQRGYFSFVNIFSRLNAHEGSIIPVALQYISYLWTYTKYVQRLYMYMDSWKDR